jgi:hypothetical protein
MEERVRVWKRGLQWYEFPANTTFGQKAGKLSQVLKSRSSLQQTTEL